LEVDLPLLRESEGGYCFSSMQMILWCCSKSKSVEGSTL
jgi:hypothetical protein